MAVAFVNSGTLSQSASSTNFVGVALPGSRVNGNILILVAAWKANTSHSVATAGWQEATQFTQATLSVSVWYRKIDGTESVPTISHIAGAAAGGAQIFQYSGVNPNHVHAGVANASASGTTHSTAANSAAATIYNGAWLYFDAQSTNAAIGTPSGYTEDNETGAATAGLSFAIGRQAATAGVASTAVSLTGSSVAWNQVTFELLDASHDVPAIVTGIATFQPCLVGPYKGYTASAHITQNTAGSAWSWGDNSLYALSQTFVPTSTIICASISVHLWKTASPTDNVYIEIRDTDPNGTLVATSSSILGSTFSSSNPGSEQTFSFPSPPTLTSGSPYSFTVRRSGAQNATNFYGGRYNSTSVYADGNYWYETFSGHASQVGDLRFIINSGTEAYYFFAKSSASGADYVAFKSTSSISWSSIDTETFSSGVSTAAGFQYGNVIHLTISRGGSGTNTLSYVTFNMATGTFGTAETVHGPFNSLRSDSGEANGVSIVVRSDDTVVILYNGPQVANMGSSYSRIVYARRAAGGGWTTNVAVDAGGQVNGLNPEAVLGSSNRTHFLYNYGAQLFQRALTSANALQTQSTGLSSSDIPLTSISYDDAGTQRVVCIAINSSNTVLSVYFNSADTVTLTEVSITNAGNTDRSPGLVCNDGTDVWAVFANSVDQDLYRRKSTDDGATWDARASIFVGEVLSPDLTSLSGDGNIYQRGNNVVIPYVVNDNNTLKYDEYVVRYIAQADAWDANNRTATVALSSSDKTATLTSSAGSGVLSTQDEGPTGKYYVEFVAGACSASDWQAGIILANQSPLSPNQAFTVKQNGDISRITSIVGTVGSALSVGSVIGLAWDAAAERGWFRKDNGLWNNSGTADPATGTGGIDISVYVSNPFGCYFYSSTTGDGCSIRTETADFTLVPPVGFLSWMGEVIPIADAWNVNDTNDNFVLSNADKSLTSGSSSTIGARSTQLQANGVAGKFYAEYIKTNSSSGTHFFGLKAKSDASLDNTSTNTAVASSDGNIFLNGTNVGSTSGVALTNGDVLSLAWDAGLERIWFRKNALNWNNTVGDNPATGTGGTSATAFASENFALYGAISSGAGSTSTLRTESAEFTVGTYPSGFLSWMGEALPAGGPVAVNLTVGSPVLGTPSLLSPKANNLTTSSPVLGTPAFSATVILSANSLTVVSPVLGNPAFQPTVSMTANAITVVSPALGNPSIISTKANNLTVSSPVLGTPSLLSPKANALTVSSPVLGTPAFTQKHAFTANAITVVSPAIGTPALVAISGYDLIANALTVTSPSLGTPAFAGIGWTPELINTNMVGWFDAADPGSLTFSGANLTVWGDGSPASGNATPYSSGPTLTSINNLGALNFNGAQGLHRAATTFGDFSIFVLFKPSTGGTAERLIDHSYQNGFWIGRSVSGAAEWGGGIQHIVDPYGRYVAFAESVTHQIFYQRTGTTQNVVGNGGTVSTSGSCPSTTTTSNLVAIGTGYDDTAPSDRLNNDVIGEIIIWSRAISASEQEKTEGYLAWKWGIVASLPGGHPYKTSPPPLVDNEVDFTANSLTVTSPSLGTPSLLSPKANALTVSSPVLGTPSLLSPKANSLTVSSPVLGTPSLLSPKANALTVSSPVLGTPTFTQKHTFTANAITVVSPALGNPSLLSPKANALTVSSPVLGSPAITQTHIRTANNLTIGLPAIGTPSLLSPKANNLTVSSPVIGTPSLLNPKANALTVSSPVLGTPSLLSPKANNLTVASPVVIPPSFTQNGTTTASPIVVESPDIGTPAFTQKHVFTANAITVASLAIGTPAFVGVVTFTANAITTVSPALGSPAITQKHAFTANALTVVSPAIGTPAITQKHIRTANNLTVTSPAIGTPALGQKHAFTANALTVVSPAIGTPAITQKHVFTTSLTVGSPVFGNAILSINGQTTANPIIVASPSLGNPALAQKHVLAANAITTVSPALGTPALVGKATFAANAITVSSPVIGVPAFKQAHAFIPLSLTTSLPVIGTPIFFIPSEGDANPLEVGSPEIGSPVLFAFYPLLASKLTVGRPIIGRPLLSKIDDYAKKIYPRRRGGIVGSDTGTTIWFNERAQDGIRGST